MTGQSEQQRPSRDRDPAAALAPVGVPAAAVDTSDVAALLAEIDAVLEENAEEFVRGFIQKGGQ